jgi:hypothetical protein
MESQNWWIIAEEHDHQMLQKLAQTSEFKPKAM